MLGQDRDSSLIEAISAGVRQGFLDVAARLMPELQATLRAERLTELASQALERGDTRAALECQAAAFADAPSRERLEALERILSERGDVDARARAILLYAERAPEEERAELMVRRAELYRAVGDPMAEADALIEAIRASDALPAAIFGGRDSTSFADQAILEANMGELGASSSRRVDDRIAIDAPFFADTQRDGVPLGPAEAMLLHVNAGDVESLVERIQDAIAREESIDHPTWLRAGRFLSAMGRIVEARQALARATGVRATWDRAASEVLASQGDHREAARALVATELPQSAIDLRRLGELYLLDGDEPEAMRWFEKSLTADPKDSVAAAQLLEICSRANRNDRVEELLALHDRSADPAWHLAAARALRRRGDAVRAKDAIERALGLQAADRTTSLEPAILLFDLGRERAEDAWIDRALSEIRVRAVELGERSRAFMAAGLLVARGAACEEDRLTYESLRVDLSPAPRATLPAGWADRWLIHVEGSPGDASFDEKRARAIDLDAGLLDALEAAEGVFGMASVQVVALFGDGPPAAVWDEPPRVGFAHHELVRWLPKTFRFEVGRAIAALSEPRLRTGLIDPQLSADGATVLLDRAGLLVAEDPVPILDVLGAKTPRGRALTAFAVSDELYALWARIGLGVVAINATVAKPTRSA